MRLLYALAGMPPPSEDIYDFSKDGYGREGVKAVVNAALCSPKPLKRFPKGTRQHFPKSVSYHQAWTTIVEQHPPLADRSFKGVGLELQCHESEMMMDVLLHLKQEGIVALPIHDCVLVPRSQKDEARRIMVEAFQDRTGFEGTVSVD
jgi:hypothetical protein